MGACVSTPEGCVGGRLSRSSKNKNRKRRRAERKRKVPSRLSEGSRDKAPSDRSSANPTVQGLFLSLSLCPQHGLQWRL
jgi:hypothetical protein